MRDVIDERDEKARISRSIIKFWNVNYIPRPIVEEPEHVEESADNLNESESPLDMELAGLEVDWDDIYNDKTGAYSGLYGLGGVANDVTRGQIDKILHEKTDALRELIQKSGD